METQIETPREALEAMIQLIDDGKINPSQLIVMAREDRGNNKWVDRVIPIGFKPFEIIGYIEQVKHTLIASGRGKPDSQYPEVELTPLVKVTPPDDSQWGRD